MNIFHGWANWNNKLFKCKSAILFQILSNITYTCAGWAGNWVRGSRGQDKKLGHFYVVTCEMTIGVESITRRHTSHQAEVNSSTVSQHWWNNMFSAPPIFSRKPLLCQLCCSVAAPPSHPSLQQQPRGWAGLVTEKQQNAIVEAEGGLMEWWLGWYWCSEGWETLDRSWRRLVVDRGWVLITSSRH